ncbi:uncharacterized protein LOC135812912 [Sycon ciliatum]|uniref:uncharacterized protein LOC135812912 n=1 Tax=Sycon ciliatum TaxID=27933 RepID=UPI0031F7110D
MAPLAGMARTLTIIGLIFSTISVLEGSATLFLRSWLSAGPRYIPLQRFLNVGLWKVCATGALLDRREDITSDCGTVASSDFVFAKAASVTSVALGALSWIFIMGAFSKVPCHILAAVFSFLQCVAMLIAGILVATVNRDHGLTFLSHTQQPIPMSSTGDWYVLTGNAYYLAWGSSGCAMFATVCLAASLAKARSMRLAQTHQYQMVEVVRQGE